MRAVLLDTCAAISMMNSRPMPGSAREAIIEAGLGDGIYVSPVTAWEIGLLARGRRAGAVTFLPDVKAWMARLLGGPAIRHAPFTFDIALESASLPGPFHNDPADRLLVATARHMLLPLVTSDRRILAYAEAGHVHAVAC